MNESLEKKYLEQITELNQELQIKRLLLHQTELKIQTIVDASVHSIIAINHQGLIELFNPTAEKMFGYTEEEVLGKNVKILMPEEIAVEHDGYLKRFLKTKEKHIIGIGREIEAKRKDGTLFPAELAVSEIRIGNRHLFTAMLQDITKKKEYERRMAAGIAHEVKNPLAIIVQGLEYVSKKNQDMIPIIADIKNAVNRIDFVIKGLLDFSSLSSVDTELCDLNILLNDAVIFLKNEFQKRNIKIENDFSSTPLNVMLDHNKMGQVFMNLLINAAQAIENDGIIKIKTFLKKITSKDILKTKDKKKFLIGEEIAVAEIIDSGPGIPESVLPNIFKPFFTTKKMKGGTGLGLAIIKNIIELHKGKVKIQNHSPHGVKITLFLSLAT